MSKRKVVTNEEEARVGRDAFFNFMKMTQHELGEMGSSKFDTKVKEQIVNKWRKLNTKEKAAYGSAIEGRTRPVKEAPKESSFRTRCSLERLYRTVEKFLAKKQLTINGIGFGKLASLSCTRLHRQFYNFMVEQFNPKTSTIELHDKVLPVSAAELGWVMCLKNSGEEVELGGVVTEEKEKTLVKRECGKGLRVLLSDLAVKLENCEIGDDDFKVRFVMFALGTVLCLTSSLFINGNYLSCLSNPEKIWSKSWAEHAFNVLCEGVKALKNKKVSYLKGSLLFLQLFYLDSIVHGREYVHKCLVPIMAWDNNGTTKSIRWIRKQGGFDSPTVGVMSRQSRMNVDGEVNIDRIVQEVAQTIAQVIAPIIEAKILPVL